MQETPEASDPAGARVTALLAEMSLEEKIGQLSLVQSDEGRITDALREAVHRGRVGGVMNEVDPDVVDELQRTARESRLGIPLLVGRDVIHGFETVFPIPLGQGATWNPDLVEACARAAALEASARGVNWTFGPGVDVCRDPRWGRIAETFGEDPVLTSRLGAAAVRGFQTSDLSAPGAIAACAKHFAGYGASQGGRDYAATDIPPAELRAVHLPPFQALVEAGVGSLMASFSDLDGVPSTANAALLTGLLRGEWAYDGLVVSDWNAIPELSTHGLTAGDREAALAAARAGVDMEMHSRTFADHLGALVEAGEVTAERLDAMVAAVLRLKLRLGLLGPATPLASPQPAPDARALAREAARQSLVLLKNDPATLPLRPTGPLAVIGPLADDGYEQLGTWIFDGDPARSVTPLAALRERLEGAVEIRHARGVETTRSLGHDAFGDAVEAARGADVALLFVGEESILSGEAHCRAHLGLPGAQTALVHAVAATGTPVVLVVLAGRPLALTDVVDHADAILYAWHPGSQAGPALADVLLGDRPPSGKLPVTFPKTAGQIPIFYAHKRTGRPPTPESVTTLDQIEPRAAQTSVGNTSFYLDVGDEPLFPFGFGLSYTTFAYAHLAVSAEHVEPGGSVEVTVEVTNTGAVEAEEVVQLYVRDPVASRTRPVRELADFRRVRLGAGETRRVAFELHTDALAGIDRSLRRVTEAGRFDVGVGADSTAPLSASFWVAESAKSAQPGEPGSPSEPARE